ncbi:MAG: glycosyltransferase family 39 protein [Terrisporobacter sp.]
MNKLRSYLLIIFNIIFLLTMFFFTKIAIFDSTTWKKLNSSIIIIFSLLLLFCLVSITYLLRNVKNKTLIIVSLVSFIVLLGIQFYFALNLKVAPSWDFGVIYKQGADIANGSTILDPYFYVKYPNNIAAALFFGFLYKVFNIFHIPLLEGSIFLNLILIDFALIILYLFISKLYNLKVSTITSLLVLLITPFYTYVPIFYTDTLTMFFPILCFYLYYLYQRKERTTKLSYLYLIVIGILLPIGIALKTNILISYIALIIFIIFTMPNLKAILKPIAIISLLLCTTHFGLNSYFQKWIPVPLSDAGFPPTHWVMMGLTGVGGYNEDDVQSTLKAGNKEAQKEMNISVINERLADYSKNGYSKFLNKKLQYTWGNGAFFADQVLGRKIIYPTKVNDYISGEKNKPFLYFSTVSYVVMMLLIIINSISMFSRKNIFGYLFNILIFGTALFLIIWEANSRYLVCILPILIASASGGLEFLSNIFSQKSNNL